MEYWSDTSLVAGPIPVSLLVQTQSGCWSGLEAMAPVRRLRLMSVGSAGDTPEASSPRCASAQGGRLDGHENKELSTAGTRRVHHFNKISAFNSRTLLTERCSRCLPFPSVSIVFLQEQMV